MNAAERGGPDDSIDIRNEERCRPDARAPHPRRRHVRPRSAEDARLVRRVRLQRHDGLLHAADAHPRATRVSGHLRRVFRWSRPDRGAAGTGRGAGRDRQHDRRRAPGPPPLRLLHELERDGQRRGIRVPSSCNRSRACRRDRRIGRVLDRSARRKDRLERKP